MSARTIRFWSDIGAVSPIARSAGGYRLFDAAAVERIELVHTLRQLGLDLPTVHRVLEQQATLAEVAETHVRALDAQIRSLRLSRAVLSTVAKRGTSTQEMTLIHKLAQLSARERQQIIDGFTNYGGSTTCCAGTWHALVSILGKSGGSGSFDFSDASGTIDVHESECDRKI
ncbi:helix-turn-helix domain-containing protein [Nocardia tengchongensis]|uniref:helix-turn-helix domain-containing protein n=1 Tax=Nocardia tengchongensis TaxID=2055889 RepID=UPI00364F59AC